MFHFKNFFLMNFREVYEYFRKIFLFLSHIDFSSLIARRSVHLLKSRKFLVHVRIESTIWNMWIVQIYEFFSKCLHFREVGVFITKNKIFLQIFSQSL